MFDFMGFLYQESVWAEQYDVIEIMCDLEGHE